MIVHCTRGAKLYVANAMAYRDIIDRAGKRARTRSPQSAAQLDADIVAAQKRHADAKANLVEHELVCDDCTEKVTGRPGRRPQASRDTVRRIISMIRDGMTYQDIGDTLGISTNSVTYQANKHGVTSRDYKRQTEVQREAARAPEPAKARSNPRDARAWIEHALCAQTDAEAFYPEKGESPREAKKICNGDPAKGTLPCPVRAECLEYALVNNEGYGVFGGLSERERRLLRRQRSAA